MLSYLERQTKLTGNQRRVILAAALGDLLEFFSLYLMAYVLAFIVGPWKLTFGQSAVVLLSSGLGVILGGFFYGWLADRIGRRKVFMMTVLNLSLATGVLAFTPEFAWLFLTVFNLLIGFGAGGLYCVDLPLVQEFVPASKRGLVSGIVTSTVPLGTLLAALVAATLTPYVGWRGLFAIGALPGFLVFLIRVWVPESPRWLLRMGRPEEARRSLAWALEMKPADLPLTAPSEPTAATKWTEIFGYRRSLLVSWGANLCAQVGTAGFKLWTPTLLALVLGIAPARAAFLMVWVNLAGFFGRIGFSFLSELIGRRLSAALYGFTAAVLMVVAGLSHDVFIGAVSVFWLLLLLIDIFVEGGWAIVAPYSGEVWPARVRTTGMGSAYGFGGLGKMLGPLGLALIVGASNFVTPQASTDALLPAYIYLGSCFALVSVIFLCFARETKGRSLEAIDQDLRHSTATGPAPTTAAGKLTK